MASRLYPSFFRKNSSLCVDVPCFISPCALRNDSLRPDLFLVTRDKCLYVLELTVGFEVNLKNHSHRKQLTNLDYGATETLQ